MTPLHYCASPIYLEKCIFILLQLLPARWAGKEERNRGTEQSWNDDTITILLHDRSCLSPSPLSLSLCLKYTRLTTPHLGSEQLQPRPPRPGRSPLPPPMRPSRTAPPSSSAATTSTTRPEEFFFFFFFLMCEGNRSGLRSFPNVLCWYKECGTCR